MRYVAAMKQPPINLWQ